MVCESSTLKSVLMLIRVIPPVFRMHCSISLLKRSTKCSHRAAQPILCTQATCAKVSQDIVHGVSATQPVTTSPQLEHFPCQHGTGTLPSLAQADIQVMPITAFGISTFISRYSKALPAGAAHAVPDSQPTEEDPGKHSQTSMLPSQQSDVHKQQRPLALLRAAAAKRALDRDAAGSRAGPMKQPRSSDARPCRSEHSVATPGQLAWLAAHIAVGIVAVHESPKTVSAFVISNTWPY